MSPDIDPTALPSDYAPPAARPNDCILVFRVRNRFSSPAYAALMRHHDDGFYRAETLPRYDDGHDFSYGQLNAGSVALARTMLRACVPVEDAEIWAENFARRILCQQCNDAWHMSVSDIVARVATWNAKHPEAKFRAGAVLSDESEVQP